MTQHNLKVGDILVAQWGATMRLVDFYQVTKLVGKKSVELQEIDGQEEATGFLSGETKPMKDHFRARSEKFQRRIFWDEAVPDVFYPYVKIGDSRGNALPATRESYHFDHCD